jgi:hypothetical protein
MQHHPQQGCRSRQLSEQHDPVLSSSFFSRLADSQWSYAVYPVSFSSVRGVFGARRGSESPVTGSSERNTFIDRATLQQRFHLSQLSRQSVLLQRLLESLKRPVHHCLDLRSAKEDSHTAHSVAEAATLRLTHQLTERLEAL